MSLVPIGDKKIGNETAKSLLECKSSVLRFQSGFEKLARYRLIVILIADKLLPQTELGLLNTELKIPLRGFLTYYTTFPNLWRTALHRAGLVVSGVVIC